MEDLKNTCLNILKEKYNCIPLIYVRFVDDSLLCIKKSDLNNILKVFNSYHKSLQFTYEVEKNSCINFLDVTLIRDKNHIISN